MLEIGISAAAAEQAQEQAKMDMEQVSLGSAYVEFAKGPVWRDLQEAMDIQDPGCGGRHHRSGARRIAGDEARQLRHLSGVEEDARGYRVSA